MDDDKLACRSHWFQVPVRIRNLVYSAWSGGLGAGTGEHQAAITQAVAFMRPIHRGRQ